MIESTVSYQPHVVANLTYNALRNLDAAWSQAQSLFLEKAEESYERMKLPEWATKIVDWLRRGPRPEFDFEYELQLMEPIETNETQLPEFQSALEQYKYVEDRLARLHNRVGMMATALRTAGANDVRMTPDDFYWLAKMAAGENLIYRPAAPKVELDV